MDILAAANRNYLWRRIAISVVCLVVTAWCWYDGLVTYPRINQVQDAFAHYQRQHPADGPQTWPEFARAHGYPAEPEPRKSKASILTQYIMASLAGCIGLASGVEVFLLRRRWIRMDDSGLSTSDGRKIGFDTITALNQDRWASKGIALVYYGNGSSQRQLVLDDARYDTAAVEKMVEVLQARLAATANK